ncbi:MAG: hypothetical protein F6K36_14670 [Symploca sp. SIO3C6]|uniref:Type II secretion system protein n=1 Tax=Symploca sp. SIO1C4 TaxID=2607765 RepID=A0A6B3N414_9CYAN|nr:hypothetical protein [Symploca sp. SIO3C6]NER26243.1 hypothetical protein [Symploca sp. SIO1C4]
MSQSTFDRTFAFIATVAVVIGIAAGFWVIGTPHRQRQITADKERIRDLERIAQRLYRQAEQTQNRGKVVELPEFLEERDLAIDQITNTPYEYRRQSSTTYELCANFDTDSATYRLKETPSQSSPEYWQHPQGRHCFEFNVLEEPPSLFRF